MISGAGYLPGAMSFVRTGGKIAGVDESSEVHA